MNLAVWIVGTCLFKMVVEQKICGSHGLATHFWKLLAIKLYDASEPAGAVLGMLAGVVVNVDTQDQFLSWEDSENSSRGDCQEAGKLCGKFGTVDLMVEAVEEGVQAVQASQGEVVHEWGLPAWG